MPRNASKGVSGDAAQQVGDALSPLESLQRFLRDSGVSVSDAIEIIEDDESRRDSTSTSKTSTSSPPIKVVLSRSSTSAVSPGTLLANIPKDTAVLSVRNSASRDFLEEEKIGGGLALLLATMAEVALGEKSKFFHYLNSLPPRGEYLPVLWPRSCREELLKGTSLSPEDVEGDRERVSEDWEEEGRPFFSKHGAALLEGVADPKARNPFSARSFFVAATWAASRAFGVDDDHGQALVPLADAFNHKAAVVELRSGGGGGKRNGKGATFEVERACLEEEESESEEEEEEEEDESDESESDESESEEGEEGEESAVVCFAPPRSDGLALDIAICGCDDSGVDSLAIYAASELKSKESGDRSNDDVDSKKSKTTSTETRAPKTTTKASTPTRVKEIFNCYGELGNRELLSKYGFCLPDNPFDSIGLRPGLLLLLEQERKSPSPSSLRKSNGKGGRAESKELRRLLRRRARWLRARSDLLDGEDGGELAITAGFGRGGEGGHHLGDGKNKKRKSSLPPSSAAPSPPFVPTLSPGLRAVLTVLCAPEGEEGRGGRGAEAAGRDDDDGDDSLQRLLAPRWWLREQREPKETEDAEGEKKKKKRRRPPLLGPLPLTERALSSADPSLPLPLSLEVLSAALRERIAEFGLEPDYETVLSRWRQAEEEEGEEDDVGGNEDDVDVDVDERASRAVRACSLLRDGELSLLREALRACESLLMKEIVERRSKRNEKKTI